MVVVESYTKLIADAINTHLPNSSYNNAANVNVNVIKQTTNCIYSSSSTAAPTSLASILSSSSTDDRSRLLVILKWIVQNVKAIYILYLEKYMTHPITLAFLPMVVGICIGIMIGYVYAGSIDTGVTLWKMSFRMNINSFFGCSYFMDSDGENDDSDDSDDGDSESNDESEHDEVDSIDNDNNNNNNDDEQKRDHKTRKYLQSKKNTTKESSIPTQYLPQHIAIIMDGNRRYGIQKYNSITRGHWDGSKTLLDFGKWCIAEQIQIVTVYAFSTENWNRNKNEVQALMNIFCKYCEELRVEAHKRGICVRVLSTETDQIPKDVAEGIHKMVEETKNNTKLIMNICLSYGSRGEIKNACQSIASDIKSNKIQPKDITESLVSSKMLTNGCRDPDLVIRTSGEYRLSNFLLWQLAYSEMFFLDKNWPELTKRDLLDVIHSYAVDRKRRYGK